VRGQEIDPFRTLGLVAVDQHGRITTFNYTPACLRGKHPVVQPNLRDPSKRPTEFFLALLIMSGFVDVVDSRILSCPRMGCAHYEEAKRGVRAPNLQSISLRLLACPAALAYKNAEEGGVRATRAVIGATFSQRMGSQKRGDKNTNSQKVLRQ